MFEAIADRLKEILVIPEVAVNTDNTTVLDIRLVDENDTELQPNGEVSVVIPKPAGYSYNLQLFHQHGEDLEKINYQWNDKDEMVFRTDKFSLYTIIDLGAVNTEELRKLVEGAGSLIQDEYTPSTWTAFENAKNTAEILLQDGKATQEQVNIAMTALQEAMNGLEKKAEEDPPVVPIDKTALGKKLETAKLLKETEYKAESWKIFKEAIAKAEIVYADPSATQEQVDAAEAELNQAMKDLKKNETESGNGETQPGGNNTPGVSQNTSGGNQTNNTSGVSQNTSDGNQTTAAPRTADDSPVRVLISIALIAFFVAAREMYFKVVQRRKGRR